MTGIQLFWLVVDSVAVVVDVNFLAAPGAATAVLDLSFVVVVVMIGVVVLKLAVIVLFAQCLL